MFFHHFQESEGDFLPTSLKTCGLGIVKHGAYKLERLNIILLCLPFDDVRIFIANIFSFVGNKLLNRLMHSEHLQLT